MKPDAQSRLLPFYAPQSAEVEVAVQAHRNRLPLLLKGPTGCGKTRFVTYLAAHLGLPLHTVSCHDDLTAADLVGRHLIGHDGTFWADGPLTRAVREGGICYLDEIVEARNDTTVVLHPLADDRRMLPIERTGERLVAPDSFMLVVSFNPGYQHAFKALKPSTRQRFVSLNFDFPTPAQEHTILMGETACTPLVADKLVDLGGRLRKLKNVDLDEGASTRLLVYAATLITHGTEPTAACRAAVVETLTDDRDTAAALMELVHVTFGR